MIVVQGRGAQHTGGRCASFLSMAVIRYCDGKELRGGSLF